MALVISPAEHAGKRRRVALGDVFGKRQRGDCCSEAVDVRRHEVRHLIISCMAPVVVDDMECRRKRSQITSSGRFRRSQSCWTNAKRASLVRGYEVMEKEKFIRFCNGETLIAPVTEKQSWRS
jgi:hypothetical protein